MNIKHISTVALLTGIMALPIMTSCGDNENFSVDHVLTPDELAEMRRQDSIAEVLRNTINADLVLTYDCEFYISESSYDGTTVNVEIDKIAELFGLTHEQVIAGIAEEEGAPEILGLAIEGTTHADNMTKTNTNSSWGHWWSAEGNVTQWGADAYVFAEYDPEAEVFNVGQYPGHCVAGTTYQFIEGLRYQDYRVAVVIRAKATERGEVVASVVGTQELTLTTKTTYGYEAEAVPGFDADKLLSDLGIASIDEASWLAVKTDGSYAQEYNADFDGFWYDMQGFAGQWGDNASVYCGHSNDTIVVGQFPARLEAGTNLTIQYGAIANDKIELLTIHVIIEAGDDINAATVVDTQNLSLVQKTTYGYESVEVPGQDLAKAMTDLGVASLDEITWIGTLPDGTYTQAYTADPNAFWYDMEGYVGSWGDSASVFCGLYDGVIKLGQYPDHLHAGDQVTVHYGAYANGKIELFNITLSIVAGDDINAATLVGTQELTLETETTFGYEAEEVPGQDFGKLFADLGVTSIDEITWFGVQADGTYTQAYTADPNAFWYDLDGFVGSHGDNASVYCGLYDGVIKVGQFPDRLHAGDKVTVQFGGYANGKAEIFKVTVVINEYVDPETAPEGQPENMTQDITLAWTCNADWAGSEEVDVRETLRNAFKMTTYQIFQAFQNGELKMYNGQITETDPVYTGEAPGYWLNVNGESVEWGSDAAYYCFLELRKDACVVYGANHPENLTTALDSKLTYYVVCNGATVTFNININIAAPAEPASGARQRRGVRHPFTPVNSH